MLTGKHNDEKLTVTLLIEGIRFISYHFFKIKIARILMTIVGAEILHLVKVVVVMLKPNVNGMILQRKISESKR